MTLVLTCVIAVYWEGVAKIGVDVQYVITGIRSKNMSEVFAMTQPTENSNELLDTLELLKKDVEKAMKIARRRAEQNRK